MKKTLAATDWLIDQRVYRRYGLTKEEIAVVRKGVAGEHSSAGSGKSQFDAMAFDR